MDSPIGVETLNSSLSCLGIMLNFITTYGVTKHKLTPRSSEALIVDLETLFIPFTTSYESFCSWQLLRAYKWILPPQVSEVVLLFETWSSGEIEEDWALLPLVIFFCLFFVHYLIK